MDESELTTGAAASWREVKPLWVRRSQIAAKMIGNVDVLVDIGCGAQALRHFLPSHARYIGCDAASRSVDTIICDLNHEPMPRFGVVDGSMLGVMEYLDNPDHIVEQLRQFDRLTVSYCHHHFWRSRAKRMRHWRNHFSRRQFEKLFRSHGFKVAIRKRIRFGETIWHFERVV